MLAGVSGHGNSRINGLSEAPVNGIVRARQNVATQPPVNGIVKTGPSFVMQVSTLKNKDNAKE